MPKTRVGSVSETRTTLSTKPRWIGSKRTPIPIDCCRQGAISSQRIICSGGRPEPRFAQNDYEDLFSKNSPSLAVALNWGIGSSCLKAEVKALDRVQIVRGWNSSYCGSK